MEWNPRIKLHSGMGRIKRKYVRVGIEFSDAMIYNTYQNNSSIALFIVYDIRSA